MRDSYCLPGPGLYADTAFRQHVSIMDW